MECDSVYYLRRAGEQRRAAALAGNPDLRRRHLKLADLLGGFAGRAASSGTTRTSQPGNPQKHAYRIDRTPSLD